METSKKPSTAEGKRGPDPAGSLTLAQQIARADQLFDTHQSRQAGDAYRKILNRKSSALSPVESCRLTYNLAQSYWKRRNRTKAAPSSKRPSRSVRKPKISTDKPKRSIRPAAATPFLERICVPLIGFRLSKHETQVTVTLTMRA